MKINWISRIGLFTIMIAGCMLVTGCAGLSAWLSAANQMLPLFVGSIGSILVAIGALTGNPALSAAATQIIAIANEVKLAIADLQAMIAEYEANPQTTLLTKIEEAAQAITDNIGKLLGDFGLPENVSQPFISLAQLLLTQFEAWAALIPALKAAYQDNDLVEVKRLTSELKTMPLTPAAYTKAFNAIAVANPDFGAPTI